MRKLLIILFLSIVNYQLSITNSFAQSPEKMNYQGLARDASGVELANQAIALRLSIRQGGNNGSIVYQELHSVTTNQFGLFNVEIGGGSVLSGVFSVIDWGMGPYYFQVELDENGGNNFTDMGTMQFISVPYALYAKVAGGLDGIIEGTPGPTGPTGPAGTAGVAGATGATGADGTSVEIQGSVATSANLPGSGNTNGDGYITQDTGHLWIWDGSAWVDAGQIQGPAGATGPTGAAGINGTNGATGATGATGIAGTNGATGATGSTGVTGAAGTNGTNGATGATGPSGADGSNGSNGATGATGPQGATGANGTNGINGATGATGPQGPAGANGTNGSNGATGATGPQGPAGANGTNGTNGATGATGPQGPTGANGTNGTNGATGATGPQGPAGANGTNGSNGATGATGPQGPIGANGTNGTNGATGATGPQGPAGANGTNGSNGATGATGPQGPSGADGINGSNGSNGAPGATGPTGPTGNTGSAGATGPTGTANISGTLNYIPKFTPDGATLGNSQLFDNGTNIGIGTNNPAQKLHVTGSITIPNASVYKSYDNASNPVNLIQASTNEIIVGNTTSPAINTLRIASGMTDLRLMNNNNALTYFYVNNTSGNVGINTTTPAEKLQVIGSITIPNTSIYKSYDHLSNPVNLIQADINDNIIVGNTGSPAINSMRIASGMTDLRLMNHNNALTYLYVNNTSGNVGINTTTPGEKLHVIGSITIPNTSIYKSYDHLSNSVNLMQVDISDNIIVGNTGSPAINSMRIASGMTDLRLMNHNNALTYLYVNNTSGNVGINTTTPGEKLHVIGSITIPNTSIYKSYDHLSNSVNLMQVDISDNIIVGNTGSPSINSVRIASGMTDLRLMNNNNSITYLYVNNAFGNVGVGTTAPGAKLEVTGQVKITGGSPGAGKVLTSDAAGLATWQTPSGGGWSLTGNSGTTAGTNFIGTTDAVDLVVKVNGAETARFKSSGLVGIGTATPTDKLHIFGSSRYQGGMILMNNYGFYGETSGGTLYSLIGLTANTAYFGPTNLTGTNTYFYVPPSAAVNFITTGSQSRLYIADAGNVGVGTITPASKLHVVGGGAGTNALQLDNGALKVSGAAPTAFKHVTASGNITGNRTVIPNTTQANASTDIVIVTHQYNAAYITSPVGVWWNGSNWTIYREDVAAMPTGETFNVLVIKP
ncbi:MAG: hypothetical protein POELPBGB_02143 [Bacteroidia bacterium]|nr:hypothetical protein [Bacteroidia bacterium]